MCVLNYQEGTLRRNCSVYFKQVVYIEIKQEKSNILLGAIYRSPDSCVSNRFLLVYLQVLLKKITSCIESGVV